MSDGLSPLNIRARACKHEQPNVADSATIAVGIGSNAQPRRALTPLIPQRVKFIYKMFQLPSIGGVV
jgi:hypothetical protein